jgi:hypothetical protein
LREINPSTVLALKIEMYFNGQLLSTGTAFVVHTNAGPMLLTNRHNVTGKDNWTGKHLSKTAAEPNAIVISHHVKGRLGVWAKRTEPLFEGDPLKARWHEHPVLKERADFVALPLTQLTGVELFPCSIAEQTPYLVVGPAEPVSVIGFPFGNSAQGFPIWATGFVASDPDIDYDHLPILLVDCRTRQGQSGSPVVAFRSAGFIKYSDGNTHAMPTGQARFMGIYSGRMNAESDIGIVWKASAIRELIASVEGSFRPNYGGAGVYNAAPVQPRIS